MQAIGGYFSLELPQCEEYHKTPLSTGEGAGVRLLRLNTGRNCLEYILRARGYKKVYIPYYTCEVILEPFRKLGVSYEFYHVDINLEIRDHFTLMADEALLYTNYFGLKQRYVEHLAEKNGKRLIVDNTQAFYAKPIEGIDTFYTCRKFFGVPDGAYLYTNSVLEDEYEQDKSYNRFTHLLKRIDISAEEGYADFRRNDYGLDNQPIHMMSQLTQRMMQGIDYDTIADQRRKNYEILHAALSSRNDLHLGLADDAVPMAYPYFIQEEGLRERLIENKVFVARYWPNVLEWTSKDSIDYNLALQIHPLPIDQRYGEDEMNKIIKVISNQ